MLFVSNTQGSSSVTVTTSVSGNQLGGSFTLTVTTALTGALSATTAAIPYNADAPTLQAALLKLPNVPAGTIAVSRTGPDGQLGYSWTVTFLDDYKHTWAGQPTIGRSNTGLTGTGSSVEVATLRPGTVKDVQTITVKATSVGTGTAIDPTSTMRLSFKNATTIPISINPSGTTCMSSITAVQNITTSTVSVSPVTVGDGQVSHYLQFRPQYGSEVTPWINANPASSPGDCSAVSKLIQASLQNFAEFPVVTVLHSVPFSLTQGCTWQIAFTSTIGTISPLPLLLLR